MMETPVEERITILVSGHNQCMQLLGTIERLRRLPEPWPIIVVDNGSTDGTSVAVAARYPGIVVIRTRRNLGVAARNIGVAYVHTPYVAFCDAGTEWQVGALNCAAHILDAAPDVAVLNACMQVGAMRAPDPRCLSMMQSPLAHEHLHSPQLLGFMADACVMRTRSFYDVGGYWPPLFAGGEDMLMALDLADRGWRIVYADDVVIQRFHGSAHNAARDKSFMVRNAIWIAWMRRPLAVACIETYRQLMHATPRIVFWSTVADVLRGLPRALQRRRVISPSVEAMRRLLDRAGEPMLRTADSRAR